MNGAHDRRSAARLRSAAATSLACSRAAPASSPASTTTYTPVGPATNQAPAVAITR